MLSPQLRRKIFDLWTKLWSSGMTNPLTSIEQITYLLFIKQMEKVDSKRQRNGKSSIYGLRSNCSLPHYSNTNTNATDNVTCLGHENCRWSYIKENPDPNHLSQYVFPWLRELEIILKETGNNDDRLRKTTRYMEDAHFLFPHNKKDTLVAAISTIDELFQNVGEHTTGDDIMGDIFEYLLDEIQTSGKNGQFRTPRHITRFIVKLLDPKPGQRILDPAAGTCGFLINTIQYILQKNTAPEKLRLEWDGTAYRLDGQKLSPSEENKLFDGQYFSGYDNDRTMVRIGWMNMVLHGVNSPIIERQDPLSKDLDKFPALPSNHYDLVMANPPYTGTVDKGDLHPTRFPTKPTSSVENVEPITTKSELLFVWLMLDVLVVGGRAAVIVPEGLLFNSSKAHMELRRQLLFEHNLEAVISLPAGTFLPYTGVKTSILIFQKIGGKLAFGEQPRTEKVWFYEVAADGFTLDAKRNPKAEPNDLWDAIEKWSEKTADSCDYYQPTFYQERWRLVDDDTIKIFPELIEEKNKVRSIHELFKELAENADQATAQIIEAQKPQILELYKQDKNITSFFNAAINEMLERSDGKDFPAFARKALQPLLKEASEVSRVSDNGEVVELIGEQIQEKVRQIVKEFAKLDGYSVDLRTVGVELDKEKPLDETKSWFGHVRVFARRDDWQSADGKIKGSHDEAGRVRLEYLADPNIYNKNKDGVSDGAVITEYLNPDSNCIELNNFNLSAARYKPFVVKKDDHEAPAKIIRELQALETRIQDGLSKLLAMVEGVE
jgi:type I restriction enzyme M protein